MEAIFKRMTGGLLPCLLLILLPVGTASAAQDGIVISGLRMNSVKLYAEPDASTFQGEREKADLNFGDGIPVLQSQKGWLKIELDKGTYWVKQFQVKTNKTYKTTEVCGGKARKEGGYGSVRGIGGGC